ncbi:MAG: helix-turn-helix transcriptional regulator [Spirochaetales bacterium]
MGKNKQISNPFSVNLQKLIKDQDLNQSKLSQMTGFSVTSINNYLNEVNDPPISFLLALKKQYKINIDEFLTKRLEENTLVKVQTPYVNSQKYEGNYMLYFHQSSAYKGAGYNPVKDPLKYGVLSIFPSADNTFDASNKMVSVATFFTSRQEAKAFKQVLDNLPNDYVEIENKHETYGQKYKGALEATPAQVFISLKSDSYRDSVLIILNNPPSDKAYIGGIGTVNSVSHGREPAPVIQYIILSKYYIDMPDGELYNLLSLTVENIDVRTETMKLLEQFKMLYSDKNINIEEYQKNYIMQNNIERSIVDIVKRNMFLYGKISNREDDKYYRLIMSYRK